jgi:hypothetical protein
MHRLGLDGMPRRVYTYLAETGWGTLNLVSSLGAATIALSVVVFLINVARSARAGGSAGRDPWGASTLEWAAASPPRPYNFPLIPVVDDLGPLWRHPGELPAVTGLRTDVRDVLQTTLLAAEPDSRHRHPGPTIWPLIGGLATAVTFIALIFTPWGAVIGVPLLFAAFFGWAWPRGRDHWEQVSIEAEAPVGVVPGALP